MTGVSTLLTTHICRKKSKAQIDPISGSRVCPEPQAPFQLDQITLRKRDPKTLGPQPLLGPAHAFQPRHDPSPQKAISNRKNGDMRAGWPMARSPYVR